MNRLLKNLEEYGVNIETIKNRFVSDEDLYTECYKMFMEDEEFNNLAKSIKAHNIQESFNFAHNLKGVSANLGLTTLFDKISAVVEKLRVKDDSNLQELYEEIELERKRLQAFLE